MRAPGCNMKGEKNIQCMFFQCVNTCHVPILALALRLHIHPPQRAAVGMKSLLSLAPHAEQRKACHLTSRRQQSRPTNSQQCSGPLLIPTVLGFSRTALFLNGDHKSFENPRNNYRIYNPDSPAHDYAGSSALFGSRLEPPYLLPQLPPSSALFHWLFVSSFVNVSCSWRQRQRCGGRGSLAVVWDT